MAREARTKVSDLLPAADETEHIEFVPHRNGRILADKHVILSLRVTAKERYLWSLVAAKRGLTMTEVVRRTFNTLVEEEELAND